MISNITEIQEIIDALLDEAYIFSNSMRQCLIAHLLQPDQTIKKVLIDLSTSPIKGSNPEAIKSFIDDLNIDWKRKDLKLLELCFLSQVEALDVRTIAKEDLEKLEEERRKENLQSRVSKSSKTGQEIEKITKKYGSQNSVLFYVENIELDKPIVYKALILDKTKIEADGSISKSGIEAEELELLTDRVTENLNNFIFNVFSK